LNVQSTTIGASGLSFATVSSNGAGGGIALATTGAGNVTVTLHDPDTTVAGIDLGVGSGSFSYGAASPTARMPVPLSADGALNVVVRPCGSDHARCPALL